MYLVAEVENEAEFVGAWGRATNTILQGVSRGSMMGVREGAAEARERHTFKNRTGNLERSIEGIPRGWVGGGWKYEAEIRAGAFYASYVEEGTKAHFIPGNPTLAFVWKGEQVFYRWVNHPGSKPYPFMHFAYYKCERVIYREVEIAIVAAQGILDA